MTKILCSVSTRGRYHTTLPLALQAIIHQTRPVDKLVVFDDNDDPQDMRTELIYANFFKILDQKGIEWEWLYAGKKGQHHNHQMANRTGYQWVWRVDDDAIPEPNVLETLASYIAPDVGAIGGAVITHQALPDQPITGLIDNVDTEPNYQWTDVKHVKEVQHLHCTFLYRAGKVDFNTGLSRVAHREETLFTYQLYQKGYKNLVVPNAVTWHLKNPEGGIRAETNADFYKHDDQIFKNFLQYRDHTIVVLNCGMGDHVVFSRVLPEIKNPLVFTCYPEIVPGRSIAEAQTLFGSIDPWNIYAKMDQWKWTDSLELAYRKLYL